ncbi:hypothetical protein G3N57_17235, partial [Paraburkholderia sp. Se-20369]|nr:hypothetical protein [Paraburkholderia sp. Se-20369]
MPKFGSMRSCCRGERGLREKRRDIVGGNRLEQPVADAHRAVRRAGVRDAAEEF